jgi:hypothetical protein
MDRGCGTLLFTNADVLGSSEDVLNRLCGLLGEPTAEASSPPPPGGRPGGGCPIR